MTTLKTKGGLNAWLVIPFASTSSLSSFTRLINHILKPIIGKFLVVYFDYILLHSENSKEHAHHLYQVLSMLA